MDKDTIEKLLFAAVIKLPSKIERQKIDFSEFFGLGENFDLTKRVVGCHSKIANRDLHVVSKVLNSSDQFCNIADAHPCFLAP